MKNHRLNIGELELLIALLGKAAEVRATKGLPPTKKMASIVDKLMRQLELLEQ